jgi:hypothetical protein
VRGEEEEVGYGEIRASSGDRGGQLRGSEADAEQGDAGAGGDEVHREREQGKQATITFGMIYEKKERNSMK